VLEQLLLLVGSFLQKIPEYPQFLLHLFKTLESKDSLNLFQFVIWLPVNFYILVRLLQPSLKNEGDASNITYCILALLVWLLWRYYNFGIHHKHEARFVREFNLNFLVYKGFTIYVQCLLLIKLTHLIFRLYFMALEMFKTDRVVHYIFKESNLKRILSTKALMRYLIVYLILEAFYEFVNPYEDYLISGLNIWGFLTIPALIGCFLVAKKSLSRQHRSIFTEIFSDPITKNNLDLEESLTSLANKKIGTKLIVDEIFMDQILKLVVAAAATYFANHLFN